MVVGMILAAGVGKRFGGDKPKQFFLINKKPVLYYILKSFVDANCFDHIILVLSNPYFSRGQAIIDQFPAMRGKIHICEGGPTRQDSVYQGTLKAVALHHGKAENIKIISHCGARPAIPVSIILENLAKLTPGRCVNTVHRVFDTLIYETSPKKYDFIDREKTFAVLTPQSFYAQDYITAYEAAKEPIAQYTCVCSVMTAYGFPMDLVGSVYPIKKITLKSDINVVKRDLKDLDE
ncbi:MAG: 2-C-methyl-D-erythritol 4-phosphate cytidylyltransferase [Clostridia bacterium]